METKLLKKGTKFKSACITNKEIEFSDKTTQSTYPLYESLLYNIEFIEDNIFTAEKVMYDFNFLHCSVDIEKVHPDEISAERLCKRYKLI